MTLLQAQNYKIEYDRKSRKNRKKLKFGYAVRKINNKFSNKYQYLKNAYL